MSRQRPNAKLAKFDTGDEVLQKQALEAGRFCLIFEYQNDRLPDPVEVAAHVLGEEPDPNDLRLRRYGSQLYRLFGAELADYDTESYVIVWERFGCRDELIEFMRQEDAQRP